MNLTSFKGNVFVFKIASFFGIKQVIDREEEFTSVKERKVSTVLLILERKQTKWTKFGETVDLHDWFAHHSLSQFQLRNTSTDGI
jgi:hypothetical protein